MAEKGLVDKKTTIVLKKETRDSLAAIGGKDQSFDEIIRELLRKWNEEN
jgi:hypothetical protein